jgi:hypothetical protein
MTLLEDWNTIRPRRSTGPAVVGLGRGWERRVRNRDRHRAGADHNNLRHSHGEITVTFSDGRRETGQVAGADADLDVAVISEARRHRARAVARGRSQAGHWSRRARPRQREDADCA